MRTLLTSSAVVILSLTAGAAKADGLLYQLPKDGSSVTFDMKLSYESNGMERTADGSFTMSSVGVAEVNNEKCRWIEFKMVMKQGDRERTNRGKVLIPETHLGKGKTPLKHAKKGWYKLGNGTVKEITDFESASQTGPIPMFLAAPLDSIKKLEKATVKSGLGNLKCEGVTGTTAYKQGSTDTEVTYTIRFHEKAPFGVVASEMQVKMLRNGQAVRSMKMIITLKEVGQDAKSELPDNN